MIYNGNSFPKQDDFWKDTWKDNKYSVPPSLLGRLVDCTRPVMTICCYIYIPGSRSIRPVAVLTDSG